jgi:hypothetical protein
MLHVLCLSLLAPHSLSGFANICCKGCVLAAHGHAAGAAAAAAFLLQGESLFVRPPQPSSSLTVQLAPARDTPVMLLMKVLVGSRTSQVGK